MTDSRAASFEADKNRKAFTYTAIICGLLLLLFFLISWKVMPPTVPVVQDLIEINLGNNEEGFGDKQPLIRGNKTPSRPIPEASKSRTAAAVEEKVRPDDNASDDAAPVNKPAKKEAKTKQPRAETPIAPLPAPKPQRPRVTYNGPATGQPGNNPNEDNGYRYQGNKPGGKGDAGDPNGNKDSYGKSPGGRVGGPRVTSGNRKIVRYYNFTGELPKATIFATINVSPAGKGTFIGFDKGSTNRSSQYADDIRQRLASMEFDKASEQSRVTVQFNYNIN